TLGMNILASRVVFMQRISPAVFDFYLLIRDDAICLHRQDSTGHYFYTVARHGKSAALCACGLDFFDGKAVMVLQRAGLDGHPLHGHPTKWWSITLGYHRLRQGPAPSILQLPQFGFMGQLIGQNML